MRIRSGPIDVRTTLGYVAANVGVAVLYALAAKWGLMFWTLQSHVTLVWPPTGIALAAVVIGGYRMLPAVGVGALLANVLHDGPWPFALATVPGNCAEAFVGAYLLRRVVGFQPEMARVRDVVGLIILAAGVSTTASATVGVAALHLSDEAQAGSLMAVWTQWWAGDALGDLIVAPVLITFAVWVRTRGTRRRLVEAMAFFAALAAVSFGAYASFAPPRAAALLLMHVPFPFLIWAAFRYGPVGTSAATLIVSGIAVAGAAQGLGPLSGYPLGDDLALRLSFLAVLAVTAMILSAVVAERNRWAAGLRGARDFARLEVQQRTAEMLLGSTGLQVQIAERERAEARVEHLNAVLRAVRNISQLIRRVNTPEELLTGVCEQLTASRGCHSAWVALADESQTLTIVAASSGAEGAPPITEQLERGALPAGWEAASTASVPVILCTHASGGLEEGAAEGAEACGVMAARLAHGEEVFGVVAMALPVELAADAEDQNLFAALAGDVAFALHNLNARAGHARSEERLRLISRATRDHIWDWDIAGKRIWRNQRYQETFGVPPLADDDAPWWKERIHPEDRPRVLARLSEALSGPDIHWTTEYRLRRRDGDYADVVDRAFVVRDGDGTAVRAIGTLEDVTSRKQAEISLRQMSNTLNSILASASAYAIAAIDRAFRVVHFNPAAEQLFAQPADTVVGRTLREIHARHGLPNSRLVRAVKQAMRAGKWEATFALHRGDGQAPIVHAVVMPMHDEAGNTTGFVLFARDVTAQRRAEELGRVQRDLALALGGARDLETALRLCVETGLHVSGADAGAVYLIDDDTASLELAWQTGLPGDLLPRISHYGPTTPDTALCMAGTPVYLRPGEQAPRLDIGWRTPELGVTAIVPIRHEGRVIGSLNVASRSLESVPPEAQGSLETIAAQMGGTIARLRADDERSRLATAVEQAAEGILIANAEGRIEYVNPAFERITGHPRSALVGQDARFLQSETHEQTVYHELRETVARGETWSGRLTNRKRDGTLYQAEATISPVRDRHGRIVNYVAVHRDVTREATLEAQLRTTQKMRAVGRLAGGVAHQLNNLLTAILGHSEAIAAQLPGDHPASDAAERIRRSSDRAAELIRQLMAFSRQRVVEPRVLDLNTVVTNAVKLLRPLVGEQIQIETRVSREQALTRADPGQLQEILTTLSLNAHDAMPHGGTLTIETTTVELREVQTSVLESVQPGRYVTLAVSDTGCGMDSETQSRLFEPFFTTKPVGQSTGLGLATVYGIVHQHGGRIVVHSVPGRGSTFRIYLPRHKSELEGVASPAVAPRTRQAETILLVEDEPEVREIERDILVAEGYTVLAARHADEALEICAHYEGCFDLLVTDMVMPGMSGRELAELLTQRQRVARVLYISGFADNVLSERELRGPGVSFLAKPFTRRALAGRVQQLLGADVQPHAGTAAGSGRASSMIAASQTRPSG